MLNILLCQPNISQLKKIRKQMVKIRTIEVKTTHTHTHTHTHTYFRLRLCTYLR